MRSRSGDRIGVARVLPSAMLLAMMFTASACSSNRFQLANERGQQFDPSTYAANPPARIPAVPAYPDPLVSPTPPYGSRPVGNELPPPIAGIQDELPPPDLNSSFARNEIPPPADRRLVFGDNPNPNETGPRNRRRVIETPRPAEPGTTLELAPDGPEVVGRIVNSYGRPEPRATIQARDVVSGELWAEVASNGGGAFRISNLRPGAQYELVAFTASQGIRESGRTFVSAPNTNVVIQVSQEGGGSGSPAGQQGAAPASGQGFGPGLSPPATVAPGMAVPQFPQFAPVRPSPSPGARLPGSIQVITPPMNGPYVTPPPSGPLPQAPYAPSPMPNSYAPPAGASPPPWQPTYPAGPASGFQGSATPRPYGDRSREAQQRDLDTLAAGPAAGRATNTPVQPASLATGSLFMPNTPLATAKLFTLDGVPGPTVELGQAPGDLILLDFFGSWCGPCRKCIPKLNALTTRYQSYGLNVVGIACEYGSAAEAVSAARKVRADLSIRYSVVVSLLDQPDAVRDYFRVQQFPTLLLLDRQGRVLFSGVGGSDQTFRELDAAITRQLARSRPI